jgi:CRP-like cAMP-binding protein
MKPRQPAARDGERPTSCCLVLEGLMCRSKIVGDGGRQIMAFHTPGDIPDLQSLHLRTLDHTVEAVVRTEVAFIEHDDMRRALRASPHLSDIMWRDTLIDAAIFRSWITVMGRLNAHAHMAHLFCEVFSRMHAVGLTKGFSCKLPLTQVDLADAQGLSAVHVNRVLQELRAQKLFEFDGDVLTILDWDGLRKTGDFDPTYLHFRKEKVVH